MTLPPEILQLIVDELYDSSATLRACCLVSHPLRDLAMKPLYRSLSFTTSRHDVGDDTHFLSPKIPGWKGIIHYVEELSVQVDMGCFCCDKEKRLFVASGLCADHLVPLFKLFARHASNLSQIHWTRSVWYGSSADTPTPSLAASIYALIQRPRVTTLSLSRGSPGPLSHILRGSSIRKLKLEYSYDSTSFFRTHSFAVDSDDASPVIAHGRASGYLPYIQELDLCFHECDLDFGSIWQASAQAFERLKVLSIRTDSQASLEAMLSKFATPAASLDRLVVDITYGIDISSPATPLAAPLRLLSNLKELSLRFRFQLDTPPTSHATPDDHEHLSCALAFIEQSLVPIASLETLELTLMGFSVNVELEVVLAWLITADGWRRIATHIQAYPSLSIFKFNFSINFALHNSQRHTLKQPMSQAVEDLFSAISRKLGEGFRLNVMC